MSTASRATGALLLKPDGGIAFACTYFCDLVGVKYEKISRMSFYDFVFPQDVDGARDLFERTKISNGNPVRFRFRRLDGTEVWTSIETTPLKVERGRIYAIKATISAANGDLPHCLM